MAYDITFSVSGAHLPPATENQGVWLEIMQEGKKLGELWLGQGSLSWKSKGKKAFSYYFEWKDLPNIFKNYGKKC